ncbi:hypothetical protein NKH77_47230 [Streptomyces sp. M19]
MRQVLYEDTDPCWRRDARRRAVVALARTGTPRGTWRRWWSRHRRGRATRTARCSPARPRRSWPTIPGPRRGGPGSPCGRCPTGPSTRPSGRT